MIDAATFNNLKARVKAECKRRKYTGSVESYGGASYDYTNPASAGEIIRYEHYTKLADPLTAIDGKTRKPRTKISLEDLTEMQTSLTALENIGLTAANTGCNASCTGLCSTACSGTCKDGCSGACKGGCGDACTGCTGCGGSCAYWCGDQCTGCTGCGDSCSQGCGAGCGGGCGDWCTGSCGDFCSSSCGGTTR